MKKTLLALAAVVLLGFGAVKMADAGSGWDRGGGYYGWMGGGPGYGMMGGPAYGCNGGYSRGETTQADRAKRDAFLKETETLRREMAVVGGEYQALLAQENPDPKKAGELQAKMFDLRTQLHEKAEKAGISGGGCYGMGPGHGRRASSLP